MKVPFGRFKNYQVSELLESYLQWLYFQNYLKPELAKAVKMEVYCRWPDKFELVYYKTLPESLTDGQDMKRTVSSIYLELANQFHPDHGGSTEAMKALNLFRERLLEQI